MGEAKQRKLAGTYPNQFAHRAQTEAGREFVKVADSRDLARMAAEAVRCRGGYGRALHNGRGEVFYYHPEDPDASTPLHALILSFARKFEHLADMPDWLAAAILEEPWELMARGYPVSFEEVAGLHDIFAWIPVSPEATWARCVKEYGAYLSKHEAESLETATSHANGRRHSGARI